MSNRLLDVAEQVVALAKRAGATQAEAFASRTREANVRVREGEIEELSEATGKGVGLCFLQGTRLGFAYTTDFEPSALKALVERARSLAPYSKPAPEHKLPRLKGVRRADVPDLFDPAVEALDPTWKLQSALAAERAARGFDKRITNVEEASAGDSTSEVAIASTEGASAAYQGTYVYVTCSPIASDDAGAMQTGFWLDYKRALGKLESPEQVGRVSAERAVRMLGARKVPSQKVPVVFSPEIAASFVGGLAPAVNGDQVRKRSSFLHGKLGKIVASPLVSIVDDGTLPGGLASAPFDGEGVPTRRTVVVSAGKLRSYLYDHSTAIKAGAETTGNASRGYSSLPAVGVHNFFLAAGTTPPEQIVRGVRKGLYVTSMLGRGANTVTGDYSRGARGLWIENGELTHAVQEITVAGNLAEMLGAIDAVGDDLDFRGSVGAPTIRFAELTVSGT